MKLLAVDSATQQCSVAVQNGDEVFCRRQSGIAQHNRFIFAMCAELLRESGLRKGDFDAVVYGRGPGMFTGIRVALSLAQSLGFAWGIPLVAISDLASMAQQLSFRCQEDRFLVVLDARMCEVYAGYFLRDAKNGLVVQSSPETVSSPQDVPGLEIFKGVAGGNAFREYPEFGKRLPGKTEVDMDLLPDAGAMLALAIRDILAGNVQSPCDAAPVYLRNRIVATSAVAG